MTLEQLRAKRDELVQALGIAGIRNGEDSIQYANVEKAIAAIDKEIAAAEASSTSYATRRRTVASFNSGL